MVKTQVRHGTAPRNVLKNYPFVKRCLNLRNRMDTGINVSMQDMTYKEMKWVEYLDTWIKQAENKEKKRLTEELG